MKKNNMKSILAKASKESTKRKEIKILTPAEQIVLMREKKLDAEWYNDKKIKEQLDI